MVRKYIPTTPHSLYKNHYETYRENVYTERNGSITSSSNTNYTTELNRGGQCNEILLLLLLLQNVSGYFVEIIFIIQQFGSIK